MADGGTFEPGQGRRPRVSGPPRRDRRRIRDNLDTTQIVVAVITSVTTVVATFIGGYRIGRATVPEPSEGAILAPAPGSQIEVAPGTFTARVTLERVTKGAHVWLAIQRKNGLRPLQPEVPAGASEWSAEYIQDFVPAGDSFSLMLLQVEAKGNTQILNWLDQDDRSTGLTDIAGSRYLAVSTDLVARGRCSAPPLECLVTPVGGGVAFTFGAALTDSTLIDEPECHRPSRGMGLRLKYQTSAQADGGWGVHWRDSPSKWFDASGYSALEISVKGTVGGETFQIGLKDSARREGWVQSTSYVSLSPSEFRTMRINLSHFDPVSRSSLENLTIGFNEKHKGGTVCIDEIAFVKNGGPVTPTTPPAQSLTMSWSRNEVQCNNSSAEPACRFDVEGSLMGVPAGSAHVVVFIFPTNPPGQGWYVQWPPASVGANGDWMQVPSWVGNNDFPAETGHKLRVRAAAVRPTATYRGAALDQLPEPRVVSSLEEIQGVVVMSDPTELSVRRS